MGIAFRSTCLLVGLAAQAACVQLGADIEAGEPSEPATVAAVEQASVPAWTWGFAWVNPGASLAPEYSYNSSGGINTYTGSGGVYTVLMPGLDKGGGNVQVVGYGSSPVRCKVAGWSTSATGTSISVRCHNPSGSLAASPFVVYYDHSVGGVGSAYLWYDGAGAPAYYSANASGGTNSVTRLGLGRYRADLGGIGSPNGSVHVTAYGSGPEHCSIESYWSGVAVYIRCFNASGGDADSLFSLHFTSSAPRAGMIGGHAYINGPTSAPLAYQYNQHWVSCFTTPPIAVSGFQNVYYPDTASSISTPTMSLSTAYGGTGNYCKVGGWWPQATGFSVNTQCFTPAGIPVTSPFTSSFMLASWPGPC